VAQPLPAPIATRLAETRKHALALKAVLERTTGSNYAAAAAEGSIDALVGTVYPLERAFEILTNFVVELAERGLPLAGETPAPSKVKVLSQLEAAGVISSARRDALDAVYRVRNDMQHMYPDVRAHAVYEAAETLLVELPRFFADYARWLRGLGYG
jgi:uncharacterized protein YutE (UPF0331/DUF86 family)